MSEYADREEVCGMTDAKDEWLHGRWRGMAALQTLIQIPNPPLCCQKSGCSLYPGRNNFDYA